MIALISGICIGFITITGVAILLGYDDISDELQKEVIIAKYNHE